MRRRSEEMTMRTKKVVILALGASLCALSAGCASGRSVEAYRGDTEQLLKTASQSMTDCYTTILKTEPKTQGSVVVHFIVEDGTGQLLQARVDKARSTAPESVQQCVTSAIANLRLTPPDDQRGDATFTWDFSFKEPQVIEQPADTSPPVDTAKPAT
jgi:hypothetical protein